jgi:hypothetical protein
MLWSEMKPVFALTLLAIACSSLRLPSAPAGAEPM